MTVKRLFEAIAMKANKSSEGLKIMREWIGHYDGKIIQFETDIEKFYLRITEGGLRIVSGESPSPDLAFKGSSKVLNEVFTGRRRISEAMKNWEVIMVGAGHEGFTLGRLISTIMLEM